MKLVTYLRLLVRKDEGQDLLEYALLATRIAVVCAATVGITGDGINAMWTGIDGDLFE